MLSSYVLTLTPTAPATLPTELGRAVYAELLRRVGQRFPRLTERVHAGPGPKPFTCSSLIPADEGARLDEDNRAVRPGERYFLRVSGLSEPMTRALDETIAELPQENWLLHGAVFYVMDVTADARRHPWAGRAEYEAQAAASLDRADRLPRALTLEFASPTAFQSDDLLIPVPLPDLVFGSLVTRWNAFSPVTLDADIRLRARERVAIAQYELRSRTVPHKNRSLRIGGVGRVTYSIEDPDPYLRAALTILADFALFSGVGVQTATGMGQARRAG